MRSVGVRELKERTSEILRRVSEGESVQVTHHGKVMAHLVPPTRGASPEEIERVLSGAHDLIERIRRAGVGPTDASTIMQEERRW